MVLTGILLDVSGSMRNNIGSGTDDEGGPWARSIFKVIDDLIEHDVSSENHVFAIGVGADCSKEIFDVIGTVEQNQNHIQPDYFDNINKIFDILEWNGARNIRNWAKIDIIQEVVSDYMVNLILMKLQTDEEFLRKFVYEWLPKACRDTVTRKVEVEMSTWTNHSPFPIADAASATIAAGQAILTHAEDAISQVTSAFRPSTKEDVEQILEKAKSYFLKEVGTHSIFSVQDASSIIRGCVGEKELSKERCQELLKNVEPFIYGRTPLYQSLEKSTELFQATSYANHHKLLFVLSDGNPTDGNNRDTEKINQAVSKLMTAGVKVVSCFITTSKDIEPKRLYNEISPDWDPAAKFLFSLSSMLSTQLLPRAIFLKRGWKIDVANNETKLFLHVNHPDNLKEACDMARKIVCCQEALSDLLVSVDLDVYISQSTDSFEAKKQVGGTCYANASAAVLHLAMKRILGREGGYPDFDEVKAHMIASFGSAGANTRQVLKKICPKYRLHCREVNLKGAMQAIVEKRPVVAIYRLTADEWDIFDEFYKKNPTGTLTRNEIDVSKRSTNADLFGHAVVLTSYNSECLTLMNSWGPAWADIGFFRIQHAAVLGLTFVDVYWKLEDLTEGEKTYYDEHGSRVANRLVTLLTGLQNANYTCPECNETSLVTEFTGTLSKVKCPKCSLEFSTNDNTGNILALNMYLTSLSR